MRAKALTCLGLASLVLPAMPCSAGACSLPPIPPGETAEAKAMREAERAFRHEEALRTGQDALWDRADHVFLARVVDRYDRENAREYSRLLALEQARLKREAARAKGAWLVPARPIPILPPSMLGEGKTVVRLEPLTALKGVLPPQQFEIVDQQGWSSCGPLPQFDAFSTADGGLVVVFVIGPYPSKDSVMEAMEPRSIVGPRLGAALARAGF